MMWKTETLQRAKRIKIMAYLFILMSLGLSTYALLTLAQPDRCLII
jgi:hypothetical protein